MLGGGRARRTEDGPLRDPAFRRLFGAQVVALLGTGLTTVALSLLAYDLAERNAGAVLGVALALKMVAYVVVAPVAAGLLTGLDRRRVLVALDLVRAAVVLCLPFVTAVWQAYVLIVLLSAASAAFTPTFQSVVPELLGDERRYTRALSLSRMAYELENLASPALAAIALLVVGYGTLFTANALAFLASAALVTSVRLPRRARASGRVARPPMLAGVRRFLTVPQLRALAALDVAVAAGSAMVIVNTVILVREGFGQAWVAAVPVALAAAGGGAMLCAFLVPRLLHAHGDRTVMLTGGLTVGLGLAALPVLPGYGALLGLWATLGAGLALVETPSGRLVHRAAAGGDGSPLFAAQFSISHACWLVAYPVAGVLGARIGTGAVAEVLAVLALAGTACAWLLWPTAQRRAKPRPVGGVAS